MKLLQPILVELDGSFVELPVGLVLREADTIDVDPRSLEADTETYSTQELAKMVERWIAKNKSLVDSGKISSKEWDYITGHLLQLMKSLHSGDKASVLSQRESLSSKKIANPRLSKLHGAVLKVYDEIGSKMGSYEIMNSSLLSKESFHSMCKVLRESLSRLLHAING